MTDGFLYIQAVERLRGRAFRAGLVLLGALLLPVEVVATHAVFLWEALPERPAVAVLSLLAPGLVGLGLLAAARLRRGLLLAAATALLLALGASLRHFGDAAAAWEALSLPPAVAERPYPAVLALAAAAAGAHLRFKPAADAGARALLLLAGGAALLFYGLPARGESPAATVYALLGHLGDLPNWRFQLGHLTLVALLAWPGLAAALAMALYGRGRPTDEQPPLAIAAIYGLPAVLGMMLYRTVPFGAPGSLVLAATGDLLLLGVLLALLTSTLEVLGEALTAPANVAEAEVDLAAGAPPARVVAGAMGAWLLCTAALALWAAPPEKGVEWPLPPPDSDAARADAFGERVQAFNEARYTWDRRVRTASGTQDLLEARRAGRELVEAGAAFDAGYGAALRALVVDTERLDLAGRTWYRRVGDVNDAARAAGLPFYLDPTVYEFTTDAGVRRHFRVRPFRIEAAHRQQIDGRDVSALRVRRLGPGPGPDTRLGFSRDFQPFALVLSDEIERSVTALGAGRCGVADGLAHGLAEALAPCEGLLARLRADLAREPGQTADAALAQAVGRLTERHELQHQLDGPGLPLPAAVTLHTPGLSDGARHRVNRELSAYLREMTTADAPPALTLVQLYPFAVLGAGGGGAEHFVATFVLERLGEVRVAEPTSGEVDPAAAARALETAGGLAPETLRSRSAALWDELYDSGSLLP